MTIGRTIRSSLEWTVPANYLRFDIWYKWINNHIQKKRIDTQCYPIIVCLCSFFQCDKHNHQTLTTQFDFWFGVGFISRHLVFAALNFFPHFEQSSSVHWHVRKCFFLKWTTKLDACLNALLHDFSVHFFLASPLLDSFSALGLCCNLKCSVKLDVLVNLLLQIEHIRGIFTLNYLNYHRKTNI